MSEQKVKRYWVTADGLLAKQDKPEDDDVVMAIDFERIEAQLDRLASDKARLAMEAKELALDLDEWKEALKASEGRATAWGTAANERAARIATLEKALREAIEMVESWGAYASDYFKDKHNLAGDIAELRAALAAPAKEDK